MNTITVNDPVTDIIRRRIAQSGHELPPKKPERPYVFVSSLIQLSRTELADIVELAYREQPLLFTPKKKLLLRGGTFPPHPERVFVKFGTEADLSMPDIIALQVRWARAEEIPDWLYLYCSGAITYGNR